MKTSKIYTTVLCTVFGAGMALTAYANCGACGTEADHAHAKNGAEVKAAAATCGAACSLEKTAKTSTAEASAKVADKASVNKEHAVKTLTTAELKKVVEDDKDVVILDARSGKYDDGRRIPGAKTLSDKSTAAEVEAVVGDKDTEVVTDCSNLQCPASARLAAHLKKLGYTHVTEYPEGIAGWVEAGNTVETENK